MNEFEKIINECLVNVNDLINLFVRCRVQYWDEKYVKIADALNDLDSDLAIKLEMEIPKTGMGGLYDLYISAENENKSDNFKEDNASLDSIILNISKSFKRLKAYTNFIEN